MNLSPNFGTSARTRLARPRPSINRALAASVIATFLVGVGGAAVAGPVAGSASGSEDPVVVATVVVGSLPYGVGLDPSGHTAYVANYGSNSVSVIDTTTNTLTTTIPTGGGPFEVGVDPVTHHAYIGNFNAGTVSVIDTTTDTLTATIPVGSSPSGVGVDPSTHTAYVANRSSNSVSVIDTTTNTLTTTIPIGSGAYEVAVDPTTHSAYVTNKDANMVSVIDTTTNTLTTTIPTPGGPWGVAVDTTTQSAYVTNIGGNSVSVIDTTTNTVTTTIPVGSGPQGVAVDAATHIAYVTNQYSNSVSVIDTTTNTVTTTIPVGSGPYGVAVDPTTHSAYVTNAYEDSVSVLQGPASTPAPAVTGITPATGPRAGGTEVTITGTDLTDATEVRFGIVGPATSYTVDSDTQITAISPPSNATGRRNISVTTPDGTSTAVPEDLFTYTAGTKPTITAITPATGDRTGGTEVVITGTDLTDTTASPSAPPAPPPSPSNPTPRSPPSHPLPAPPDDRHLRIRTPDGISTTTTADRFTYTNTRPAITSITPTTGPQAGGTEVTITGTDLTDTTHVIFGSAGPATSFTVDSPTQITAIAPPSSTTGRRHLRIRTPEGNSAPTRADLYTYN